ncbi:MAG: hypothetical protein K9G48_05395 [Reyranella sp.]|nr:hypothetical protein [Reyranella sp.]
MGRLARINAKRRAVGTLEVFDGFAALRNGMRRLAAERGEWAGYPMPLQGNPLVVEPTYPKAAELMQIGRDLEEEKKQREAEVGVRLRNTFWSDRLRARVMIWNEPDGRLAWGIVPGMNHAAQLIKTLGASEAWGIEQEHNAVQLLGTHLPHFKLKQYLLTGMFMERSERSGVTYLFRRLRPTLAIKEGKNDSMRILCALCMHPVAYYEGSWAGAMTPTDDVIAALMLMRGDEHMYWRRANQHPPGRPEAGI